MKPVLSKMHWDKRHTYQTCHAGSPSQDLKNMELGNLRLVFKLQLIQESLFLTFS